MKPPNSTLRWRIHDGVLPLRQRHMRALRQLELPDALLGWVHERLEWAMINMLAKGTEAVLVLNIDPSAEVTLSLDQLREPPLICLDDIRTANNSLYVEKPAASPADSDIASSYVQVLAGDIWIEHDEVLCACTELVYTATSTLCRDLATTLGYTVVDGLQSVEVISQAAVQGQAFVISDEFGFLPIATGIDHAIIKPPEASATARIQEAFAKLW
jgi:hypothetical protein